MNKNLIFLTRLIETAELKPVIEKRYLLEKIGETHGYVEQGYKKGNVVMTVDHPDHT